MIISQCFKKSTCSKIISNCSVTNMVGLLSSTDNSTIDTTLRGLSISCIVLALECLVRVLLDFCRYRAGMPSLDSGVTFVSFELLFLIAFGVLILSITMELSSIVAMLSSVMFFQCLGSFCFCPN